MRLFLTGAAIALMLGGAASAQQPEWDVNEDGQIDRDEFVAGFETEATFGGWDANRDGTVTQGEYHDWIRAGGPFTAWDADKDGVLTRDEYAAGANRTGLWTGGAVGADDFAAWDVGADRQLSLDEFSAGIAVFDAASGFGAFDPDGSGVMSRGEFEGELWSDYDGDGDGVLDEEEAAALHAMRTDWKRQPAADPEAVAAREEAASGDASPAASVESSPAASGEPLPAEPAADESAAAASD